jgi:Leucine-rich repeat (LRR) protein
LIEIRYFKENYPFLREINLRKSFTLVASNFVLFFNKYLERAILSENELNNFPKFCQNCFEGDCNSKEFINIECKLNTLKFDSNRLGKIMFEDLMDLNNLEYLNLENNRISFIETNSFYNLINLKTLILSQNEIVFRNETNFLFDTLFNLKFLNLSSNKIEFISSEFFYQLYKLETLDLSSNSIYEIESNSFYKLHSLKSLHLNENSAHIKIDIDSFVELQSIQNLFVSKSILNDLVSEIFINLFRFKNSNIVKKSLNRSYFKSLFLTSSYLNEAYDCNLTLYFIKSNVHFNFKTEKEIFDYFNECSSSTIKNSTFRHLENLDRKMLIFTNPLVYPFCVYLFFIISIIIYLFF